jgi:DNA invertase Pin-like site-specific DNA recombinase
MLVGYARVSTADQHLLFQQEQLKAAGCEKIFIDIQSGTTMERQGLHNAMEFIRSGDIFVVWKLDRLGRTLAGLITFVDDLKQKDIGFKSLTDGIDTTTTAGRFFFHVMAALAEMERELIVERTRAGLAAAREQGRLGGRPRKMTPVKLEAAKRLVASGMPYKDVARELGVSVSRVYHYIGLDKK